MTPLIYEKTENGELVYDIFSRLVKERIIFLNEEIDTNIATTLCASLTFLDSQTSKTPISLYISSPGGRVDGFFTIYDTINYIKSPVKTLVVGQAHSAAALTLLSGTKGMRYAFPNATIMLHNLGGVIGGFSHELKKSADRADKLNDKLIAIVKKHTKQKKDKVIRDALKEETYFTAEEALSWGIIDKIIEPK